MSDTPTPAASTAPPHPEQLSMLEKRRIEAEILGHVYEVLKASHGREAAMQAIGDSVRRSAIEQGQRFAAQSPGGTSLAQFVSLSQLWEREDALKIAVREVTDTDYRFDVQRCRYSEMYRDMGLGEIGHLLSCQRDGTFCEGYDPKLKFARTQTLMQGASHCDFHYHYDVDAAGHTGGDNQGGTP